MIKKLLVVFCALFLVGCMSLPVIPPFPETPEELYASCPPLETMDEDDTKLSDLMKTVTRIYTRYYTCAETVEGWKLWYKKQKKIYESIKSYNR